MDGAPGIRLRCGMETQIPFGNDKQKAAVGMTNKKATAGMTNKKAAAGMTNNKAAGRLRLVKVRPP